MKKKTGLGQRSGCPHNHFIGLKPMDRSAKVTKIYANSLQTVSDVKWCRYHLHLLGL
jgi:hypothetical protein